MLGRSSSGAEHCDGDIRGLPDPPRKRIHSPLDGSHKTTLSGVSVNWWVAPIELVGGTDWMGVWVFCGVWDGLGLVGGTDWMGGWHRLSSYIG